MVESKNNKKMIEQNIEKKYHSSNERKKYKTSKEQFYTKEKVIQECIESTKKHIPNNMISCLDFSAGNNIFIENMKIQYPYIQSYFSYDIDPKNNMVVKQDFLQLKPFDVDVIGFNPPFGWQSCTARDFLFHAAKFNPKYLLLILPFCHKYIYPPFYKEVFSNKLGDNSFYSPLHTKEVIVKNCRFVILEYDPSFIYEAPEKEKEIIFANMKRPSRRNDGSWWPEFTSGYGFAVRIYGVNAGKQILLWNKDHGVFINHHQKECDIHSIVNDKGESISSIAFIPYVADEVPTIEFCRLLWKELRNIDSIINKGAVTSLNAIDLSKCVQKVLNISEE